MDRDEALARVEALAEMEDVPEGEVDWLLSLLLGAGDENAPLRAEACTLLGDLLSPAEIAVALRPLADDPVADVRVAAFDSLGPVLLEAAEHDLLDLEGRPEWVEDRGWVAPEDAQDAVALLRRVVGDVEEDLRLRCAALHSLGYVAHLEPVDALIAGFLERAEPEARQAGLAAAAASGLSDRWEEAVTASLGDRDPGVRAVAALTAGQLRLAALMPYLETMTFDGSETEQLNAAIASLLMTPYDEREALAEQLVLRGLANEIVEEAVFAAEELDEDEDEDDEDEVDEDDEDDLDDLDEDADDEDDGDET